MNWLKSFLKWVFQGVEMETNDKSEIADRLEIVEEEPPLKIAVGKFAMAETALSFAEQILDGDQRTSNRVYTDWLVVVSAAHLSRDTTIHRVFLNAHNTDTGWRDFVDVLRILRPIGEGHATINLIHPNNPRGSWLIVDVEYNEAGVKLEYTESWVKSILSEQTGNDAIPTFTKEWVDLFPLQDENTVCIIGLGDVQAASFDDMFHTLLLPSKDILSDVYSNDLDVFRKKMISYLAPEGYAYEDIRNYHDVLSGVCGLVVSIGKDEGYRDKVKRLSNIVQAIVKSDFYRWKKKDQYDERVSRLSETEDENDEAEPTADDQLQDKQ